MFCYFGLLVCVLFTANVCLVSRENSFFLCLPVLRLSLFLAGVLPPHSDSHALVGGYRKEQYQDLLEALQVMRYVRPSTPSTHVHLRMFQLETQVLPRCSETLPPVRNSSLLRPACGERWTLK